MGCETKRKGDVSEAVVVAELMKLGFVVLAPFGDNQPYDLVVDLEGSSSKFRRLQCKTGRLRRGVVIFNTESCLPRSGGKCARVGYEGKADYFAVYCPDTEKVYIVPVMCACKGKCHLRVAESKNGQSTGVRLASDYELNANSFFGH